MDETELFSWHVLSVIFGSLEYIETLQRSILPRITDILAFPEI